MRHPYADVPVVTAYRRAFSTEEEQRILDYRVIADGGKVWIAVPRDDGVFRNIQQVQGFPLVSDARIYLDLIHACGDRITVAQDALRHHLPTLPPTPSPGAGR